MQTPNQHADMKRSNEDAGKRATVSRPALRILIASLILAAIAAVVLSYGFSF